MYLSIFWPYSTDFGNFVFALVTTFPISEKVIIKVFLSTLIVLNANGKIIPTTAAKR